MKASLAEEGLELHPSKNKALFTQDSEQNRALAAKARGIEVLEHGIVILGYPVGDDNFNRECLAEKAQGVKECSREVSSGGLAR
jgi:hypothetical protein